MERAASWWRRHGLEVALVAPMVLFVFGFTLVPVLKAIALGFQSPAGGYTLEHWRYLFSHGQFHAALRNTLLITIIGLSLELLVGLGLAWVLTRHFRGRALVRSLLLVPMGVPTLVSAVNLLYVFSSNGYLNGLLLQLGWVDTPINWAAGGWHTLLMIVFADMWKVTPMVVLILLAGLEAIPEDVYGAAAVDGASGGQTFFRVTLPLLLPAITTAVVIRGIDAFRIFELPLVLAGRQTPVLATFAFDEYHQWHNPHTAGAAATFLMAMIMVFAFSYLRATREVEPA